MKSLHLATPDDAEKLLPLVTALHAEQGFDTDLEHRAEAIAPLLEGSPHGAVWMIGPRKAPVGYIVVTFGWSVEYGGLDAIVDEVYIRPAVRRRGMGSEALNEIALHLEVDRGDDDAQRFYTRGRFKARDGYMFMSRVLR